MVYYSVMKKNQAILMKFTNSSLSKKKIKQRYWRIHTLYKAQKQAKLINGKSHVSVAFEKGSWLVTRGISGLLTMSPLLI